MTPDPAPKRRPAAIAAISIALATSAVLSGCSSSSSSGKSSETPSTHGAPSTSSSASPTSASPASKTTTSSQSTVATGGSFCKQAALAQAQQAKQVSALSAGSPASLEKLEKEALAELPALLANAPSAIKSDVTVIVAADKKLYNALAAAHFDVRKINPTSLTGLDTPQFKNAATAITTYLEKQCGIKTTPTN